MSGPNLIYCFPCPSCGEPVVLPRQSPLGWVGSSQFLPTAVWPILFLCPQYSRIGEVSRSTVRLATDLVTGQTTRMNFFWEIHGDCCLENCGKRHAVYTYFQKGADPDSILQTFMGLKPSITCLGGHTAKFHRDRLTVNRLIVP